MTSFPAWPASKRRGAERRCLSRGCSRCSSGSGEVERIYNNEKCIYPQLPFPLSLLCEKHGSESMRALVRQSKLGVTSKQHSGKVKSNKAGKSETLECEASWWSWTMKRVTLLASRTLLDGDWQASTASRYPRAITPPPSPPARFG